MKKQVLTILQMTSHEYEKMVFDMYFSWCCSKAKNRKSLQKVLVCKMLFNWWYKELENFEKRFVSDSKPYANYINKIEAKQFYNQTTQGIYRLFSKPLMKRAHDQ